MNCYSAHLSIDVHCSLKQKKKKYIYIYIYILFSWTSLFVFFIHFIKSSHSFTLILTLSRSSLIPLKLHSLNVAAIVKLTLVRYNLLLLFFFSFFFFFSFYQIWSHSLSLIHYHLSSQASQAHSLDVAAIVKFTPVSQAHSLNVAGPTIVNVTAIVKFRPTPSICLRRTSLPLIHFWSVVSVFFMRCFGFLIWV